MTYLLIILSFFTIQTVQAPIVLRGHLPVNPDKEIAYKKEASITKYGWTGYPMANGEYPYEGAVATSDRSIKFGTLVKVSDRIYEVKDYTAEWIWKKKGLVFDIYSEKSKDEMLKFGIKKQVVEIFDN